MAAAELSIRIDLPGGARLGPGKAALLEAIAAAGSIAGAARALGMSYPKAMRLVDELNGAFAAPLILAEHGGHRRGGAALSRDGAAVLERYRSIAAAAKTACAADLRALRRLAAPGGD